MAIAMPHHSRVVKNLRNSARDRAGHHVRPFLSRWTALGRGTCAALRGCGCGCSGALGELEEQRLEVGLVGCAARGSAARPAGPRRRCGRRSSRSRRGGAPSWTVAARPAARRAPASASASVVRDDGRAPRRAGRPSRPACTSRPLAMMTTSSTVCSTSLQHVAGDQDGLALGGRGGAGTRAATGCPRGPARWPARRG